MQGRDVHVRSVESQGPLREKPVFDGYQWIAKNRLLVASLLGMTQIQFDSRSGVHPAILAIQRVRGGLAARMRAGNPPTGCGKRQGSDANFSTRNWITASTFGGRRWVGV
jgi:hypothetical protein